MSDSLVDKVLSKVAKKGTPDKEDTSVQDATKEIWEAVKSDNYDSFQEALSNFTDIKINSER